MIDNMAPYVYVLCSLMLLDIITGITNAVMQQAMDSSKLREGLFHKLSFVCAVALAIVVEYGANTIGLPFEVPIFKAVCVYLCLTEITSILENIVLINPDLGESFINIFKNKGLQ